MNVDTPTLIGLLNLILLCVLGGMTLLNRREVRALKREETQAEIATAPIEADKRSDEITLVTVKGWEKTIDKIGSLTDELHVSNELDRQRIEQTAKQLKDTSEGLHELRADLSVATNALADHVRTTGPAVDAIIAQKPIVDDTHVKVNALPGAVRTEMQDDFKSILSAIAELQKQLGRIEEKVNEVVTKYNAPSPATPAPPHIEVNTTVNPAPSTPQPTSVPEMTKQVEVVEADPSPTTPMPGGMPNGQSTTETKP